MSRTTSPKDESAVDVPAEALRELEETVQEGDHLFVLTPERSRRTSENETVGVWDNLVYHLTFFLMIMGFTCILPRQPRVSPRTPLPAKPSRFARIRSVRRLQSKHENSVKSQQLLKVNRWRVTLIYLGPLMVFIGPNLVTIGSAGFHGPAKAALVALGAVVSALPLYSTLLKKGRILNLKKDLEHTTEDAISYNVQAADELGFMTAWNWAGYLVADVANVIVGSWAAFRHDTAYGVGNAVPHIVGLCIILPLCIYEANVIGSTEFTHDIDGGSNRFTDFVSEVETTKNARRAESQASVDRKSRASNIYILSYALISLVIHIVLILSNSRSRTDVTYVVDVAIPVIINFIAATYLMARLMQQVYPNYFLAHVRAEWGAHIWRRELETKLRDSFDKVHLLQEMIKNSNVLTHILEIKQSLRAVRERLWYIKLVGLFHGHTDASDREMKFLTETGWIDMQTSFTALREKLGEASTEHSRHSRNHGLELHNVAGPLLLSTLTAEDSNQTKMDRIKRHVSLLNNNLATCRTVTQLSSSLKTLHEEVSSLSERVQQYVQRTRIVIASIKLPDSLSQEESFINRLRPLALPPTTPDRWYIDYPPPRLQDSMTVKLLALENSLREISDLEQTIERGIDETASLEQLRAELEQKKIGTLVHIRSWLEQYGQDLGVE